MRTRGACLFAAGVVDPALAGTAAAELDALAAVTGDRGRAATILAPAVERAHGRWWLEDDLALHGAP